MMQGRRLDLGYRYLIGCATHKASVDSIDIEVTCFVYL